MVVAADPNWVRSPRNLFYRLFAVKPLEMGLTHQGGVFVIWHGGVTPGWVCADKADSLAAAILDAQDNGDIAKYESRGGLYVTWAPIRAEYRDGVVRYLRENMDPYVTSSKEDDDVNMKAEPIPVLLPGSKAAP